MAQTFDNQFFKVSGNYLATDFQDSGLDSSSEGLVEGLDFVHLGSLRGGLSETWTPRSVRATCYGIQMSVVNFYAIFELYCPATGTFFTLVGELGMTLHEMWEVSALLMGSLPYEEYFPLEAKLALLKKQERALFETYRELICHFYICSDMHGSYKGSSNIFKSWADYLFPNLENASEEARFGVMEEDIL